MGKIFCIMGKSSTGKDTIYKRILESCKDSLRQIVTYTTRPIRAGEIEGREYHFTDEEGFLSFEKAGKVIESRLYQTVHGPWRYFTVDDGAIDFTKDYIVIGTLEMFNALVAYFGNEKICPVYIEIDDGTRLQRALDREKQQSEPKYEEMCRRFLADCADFSEEKLSESGIKRRFKNDILEDCLKEIVGYIEGNLWI